jgi:hypothetical protein
MLEATVRDYNAACVVGEFKPLEVDGVATKELSPRKSNWAWKLDEPPFHAYPIISANVLTFGGLRSTLTRGFSMATVCRSRGFMPGERWLGFTTVPTPAPRPCPRGWYSAGWEAARSRDATEFVTV